MDERPPKCKEINQELMYKQLPAHMIVKNFIEGEEDCNYEIYLRDFINESSFFSSLSNGNMFESPSSESDGECDAISTNYALDFKLMIATSRMEATSILSGRITKFEEGAYGFGPSKVQGQMRCTLLCQALRYKDISVLEEIYSSKPGSRDEKDIKIFLEVLHTEKNILLFLPVVFSYTKEHSGEEGIAGIQQAISFDLKSSIEYRETYVKKYDTFLATLFEQKVLFFRLSSKSVEFLDSVDTIKSKTFMRLYNCGIF